MSHPAYPSHLSPREHAARPRARAQASKFFVVFEADISYWEKTLSHVSETIEIILQVRGSGCGCAGCMLGGAAAALRACMRL